MNTRLYQKSFAGGIIAPEMLGRIDDVKYQNGAADLKNLIVRPQGACFRRPGLEYRASTARDANDERATKSRIISFQFSLTESAVIELRAWDGQNATGRFGTIRIHNLDGLQAHAFATPYIQGTTVTFTQQSTEIRVTSASWTGVGVNTPPFAEGEKVTFRTTGTLPSTIISGQTYYVRYSTSPGTGFLLSTTPTGAFVSWPANGNGTPTHTIDKLYVIGSVVSFGGNDYVAQREVTRSDGDQYVLANPSGAGVTAYWFRQFTSVLELRHNYTESELFELTYTQSFDVITLAHPNHPVREIRRYAANAWGLIPSSFNNTTAPTNVTVASTYGAGILVNYIGWETVAGSTYGSSTTAILYGQDDIPPVNAGEIVYVRAPGFPYIDNRFFVAGASNTTVSGGPTGGTAVNLRKISLRDLVSGTSAPFQISATVASGVWTITAASQTYATNNGYSLFTGTQPLIQNNRYLIPQGVAPNTAYYRFTNVNAGAGTFQVQQSADLGATWTAYTPANGTLIFWPAIGGGTTGYVREITSATQGVAGIAQPTTSIQDSQNSYRVCAVFGSLEGPPSSTVTATNNLLAPGSKNTLSWTAVANATAYNVYKEVSGLFGYVGRTTTTSFIDDNITPDFSKTTPIVDSVFTGPGLYPGAVAYFDQRKCFAGAYDEPNRLVMSRSFTEGDFSYSLPTNDSDRISIEVAAREANRIRHIVPLGELLLLTNATEWRISPVNSEALTPSTISARPQSYIGANSVQPIIVNNSAIFCAARGGHVREMGFNFQAQGFVTGDLSLRAPSLFDDYELVDMAYQKAPIPVLWAVSTSGKLLGLTYVPEEQVGAWHQHDTDGVFESVAVTATGEEDRVWVVVKRSVDGQDVRYVERMRTIRQPQPQLESYLDAASVFQKQATFQKFVSPDSVEITFANHGFLAGNLVALQWGDLNGPIVLAVVSGVTTNAFSVITIGWEATFAALSSTGVVYIGFDTVTGLDHLEGKEVRVVADGFVLPTTVVVNGQVKLAAPRPIAATAIVGLPYTSQLETLPAAMQIEALGQGRIKNINKVWLKVVKSAGVRMGPDGTMLVPSYPYNMTSGTTTEEIDATLFGRWRTQGKVVIQQDDPLPMQVLAMTYEVAVGG